jgi:hypothetical protein
MHPPFRPRLAARANPKNGAFAAGDPSLAELSALLDANSDLLSARRTAVQMLVARGRPEADAYRAVDSDIALAWFTAKQKGADAKNAILGSFRKERTQETRRASRQESLTGATEDGEDTTRDLVGVSREQAEGRVGAAERERQQAAMLASYGLAPELYKALIETSTTKAGERVKRPDDTAIAQQFGLSTKDITTLRAAAAMLARHISQEALMAADDLDDLIDALS